VETRREKTGTGWRERKEDAECRCSEMRKREGKERSEILNKGRKIRKLKSLSYNLSFFCT
jgi:hypothetical protein